MLVLPLASNGQFHAILVRLGPDAFFFSFFLFFLLDFYSVFKHFVFFLLSMFGNRYALISSLMIIFHVHPRL